MHYVEADGLAQATRIAVECLEIDLIVPTNRDGTNGNPILSSNVQKLEVSPLTQRNIEAETRAIQKKIREYDQYPVSRRSSF